jgi:hypothetical protein
MIGTSDILRSVSKAEWLVYAILAALIAGAAYYILAVRPDQARADGRAHGVATCTAANATAAVSQVVAGAASTAAKAASDIDRADKAGRAFEGARTRISSIYQRLDNEARHDTPDPIDRCVLPAERLRRWSAANAGPVPATTGPDQGAAASRADRTAPATPAADLGPDPRPGSQPPSGGPGLPPDGGPTLRLATSLGVRAP